MSVLAGFRRARETHAIKTISAYVLFEIVEYLGFGLNAPFICTILRAQAEHLRKEAKSALVSPLQKAEKILEAKSREDRAQAVSAKKTYARSFTERLVKWIGAKFITAEVVSNISELEAEVRCKLTWQEFDSCLWLCSLSTESELTEAGVVADPKEFVAQRKHLVVGFSD